MQTLARRGSSPHLDPYATVTNTKHTRARQRYFDMLSEHSLLNTEADRPTIVPRTSLMTQDSFLLGNRYRSQGNDGKHWTRIWSVFYTFLIYVCATNVHPILGLLQYKSIGDEANHALQDHTMVQMVVLRVVPWNILAVCQRFDRGHHKSSIQHMRFPNLYSLRPHSLNVPLTSRLPPPD
jgi:hypothetical protein